VIMDFCCGGADILLWKYGSLRFCSNYQLCFCILWLEVVRWGVCTKVWEQRISWGKKQFVQEEEGLSSFLLYTQKNDTECGGGNANKDPHTSKFHYYSEAFFQKFFSAQCCLSFPNTFLTWGNMSLCFRSSGRCCRKGVEVHNTLFRCFCQLFSFRSHLAIFSIKAWNNIRRVVSPPFWSNLCTHLLGGGGRQISVAFHQSWCKMFCYKFFLHQMESFVTTCQFI
jgi:hypothetical protein